jgi:TonB family protein
MTDEADPLAGIELDAWQPPPVPDGLADAVVRRMREPLAVAAHDLGERHRRRWPLWLGAVAVAVSAAASVAILAPWSTPLPASPGGQGEVIAERASHIDLGSTSAELDAGSLVRWQRDRHRVAVAQPRGAATWRIAGDDTAVIDAGAMGASVEASGASLRVEVHMLSLSDARVVAASAVTAAAVALVTVIVYQGHVRITSAGQTINVAAGGAAQIKPGEPAREVRDVAAAPPSERSSGSPAGVRPDVSSTATAVPPGPRVDPSVSPDGTIAPGYLEAHRIKGNKLIMPDSFVTRAMQSDGEIRVSTTIKLCVDTTGKVAAIDLVKSSGYPGYDNKIMTEMRDWAFRPIEVDGKPAPACSVLGFIYTRS